MSMVKAYGKMVMTQTPSLGVAGSDTIVKIPDFDLPNVYLLPSLTIYLMKHMAELDKAPDTTSGDCRFESCYAFPFLGKC